MYIPQLRPFKYKQLSPINLLSMEVGFKNKYVDSLLRPLFVCSESDLYVVK